MLEEQEKNRVTYEINCQTKEIYCEKHSSLVDEKDYKDDLEDEVCCVCEDEGD